MFRDWCTLRPEVFAGDVNFDVLTGRVLVGCATKTKNRLKVTSFSNSREETGQTAALVGGTEFHWMVGFLTDAPVDRLNDDVFCKFDWFLQLRLHISILTAWHARSIFLVYTFISLCLLVFKFGTGFVWRCFWNFTWVNYLGSKFNVFRAVHLITNE